MHEANRTSLSSDDYYVTLQSPVVFKKDPINVKERLGMEEVELSEDTKDQKYVSASDLVVAISNAKNSLIGKSPHPSGECIVAVDARKIIGLTLDLVRTNGKQQDIFTDLKGKAAEENKKGKRAANIGTEIVSKQFNKSLSGEEYIDLLNKSPAPSVTKGVIKSAQRGDPPVNGDQGSYSLPYTARLPIDLPCKDPQIIRVQISNVESSDSDFIGTVSDSGKHSEFWKQFPTARIYIQASTEECQRGLILSRLLKEPVKVEVALSLSLCRGKTNIDIVNATVMKIFDLKNMAIKAINSLNSQHELNFSAPEI